MFKKIFILFSFVFVLSTNAQAPEKMSYQAVIRNAGNALVTNQNIGMRISILQTTATGTAVYIETQNTTTNANGLASIEIGAGTVVLGTFANINWGSDKYFIKTETDPTGGTAYSITGTSQLLSVPYALYAKKAGNTNKVDLVATKIAATQTPAVANGTNTGDVIIFDTVVTTPTLGNYSTTTNTYTVGTGQGGLYYIQVRALSVDNATPTNTTGHWFKIEITPNGSSPSFVNNRDIYGSYPLASNTNFPSGLKGRSEISAMVQLNDGDSFQIKGLSANSSITNTIKNDGSCKLMVVKMN